MSNVGFSESPPSKTSAIVALVVQSPGLDETGNIFALDSGEAMRLQSEDFPEPLFPTRRRDLRRQPPPLYTSSTVLCLFESVEGVSGSGARLNSEHDHQNISIHCWGARHLFLEDGFGPGSMSPSFLASGRSLTDGSLNTVTSVFSLD